MIEFILLAIGIGAVAYLITDNGAEEESEEAFIRRTKSEWDAAIKADGFDKLTDEDFYNLPASELFDNKKEIKKYLMPKVSDFKDHINKLTEKNELFMDFLEDKTDDLIEYVIDRGDINQPIPYIKAALTKIANDTTINNGKLIYVRRG